MLINFLNLMDVIHDFVYSTDLSKGVWALIDGVMAAFKGAIG